MTAPTLPTAAAPAGTGPVPVPGRAEPVAPESDRSALTRAGLVRRVVIAVAVLLLGAWSLSAAWAGSTALVLIAAAGLVALGFAAALRRLGTQVILAWAVAVLIALGALVLAGRGADLGPLAAVTDAVPRLLTSPVPAPVTPLLVLPGMILGWLVGFGLGWRLRAPAYAVTPLVGGLVLFLGGELLVVGGSDPFGLIGLLLVGALGLHWSGWGGTGRARSIGASVRAVGAALLIGLLTLALGFVPLGKPFDVRTLVDPPAAPVTEPNPLPMLAMWGRLGDVELLRTTGDSYPLHLVVLPDYDGVSFGSTSNYIALGAAGEPELPPGRFQARFTTSVTWQTTSRWLPAPGRPETISIPDARIDPDTGSLLTERIPNGVVSYTVSGWVDVPHSDELRGAPAGVSERFTAGPELPADMVAYARQATAGADDAYAAAKLLEAALKSNRAYTTTAQGGSSIARLRHFLFDDPTRGGRVGSSEQFATAYAVLARSLGLPTRVVVGFGPGTADPAQPDVRIVRGRDALAWPEVYFEGFGWVPFNPTPDVEQITSNNSGQAGRASTPSARPTPQGSAAPSQQPVPPRPLEVKHPWLLAAGIGGAVLAVLALLLIARAVRTGRHRRQGAVGAWQEVVDGMRLAGRPTPVTEPATEVARQVGPAALAVARAAEAATFAPPGYLEPDAWTQARHARRQLRREASWWRTLLWPINPVPLLRPRGARTRRPGRRGSVRA
ncbi:transglutaminase domain-containing protein [Granulicoccus phenolivorans]|uniref:transglutaminase family protein n=1 Tax=Granulicoccus phenolivorans TaxID=266854 RepID=UPI00040A3D93|nr:transglutaminase domain-containing protein [Granulicoccus phenolivorans]